jgi:molybdate transport system regulatory protein
MERGIGSTAVINQFDITNTRAFISSPDTVAKATGPFLLERFAELGSLRDAASFMGLEEGLAWDYVVAANNLADIPLARLHADNLTPTTQGRRLLDRAEGMAHAFQRFLDAPLGGAFNQFHLRHQFLRRLVARTSARNQFFCRVRSVRRERVNAVVHLDMGGGDQLDAHITAQSAEDLGLFGGCTCHALVEPGWVEVRPGARTDRNEQQNCLHGKVVRCQDDPVDAEVAIELDGGRIIVASMTRAEMVEKSILVGQPACAVIQSSQIILAVDTPADSSSANHRGGKS